MRVLSRSLNVSLRHEVARLIVWHAVSTVVYRTTADNYFAPKTG